MKNEIWKPIKGFDYYEVSNLGRVRSLDKLVIRKNGVPYQCKGKIMKQTLHWKGYLTLGLYSSPGISLTYRVHCLVAEAFLGDRKEGMQVNHINLDKTDNKIENLEWVTNNENLNHAFERGKRGRKILTLNEVKEIRELVNNGVAQTVIARKFNTTQPNIYAIKARRTFRYLS